MMKYIVIVLLVFSFSFIKAQSYCLKFSKEGKKDIALTEGKNISFVLQSNGNWNKGKLVKITTDSLFVEEDISSGNLLTERENNFDVNGYNLTNFRRIAYAKTSRVVGEGAVVLVAFTIAVITYGGVIVLEEDDEKSSKKLFKKNIDFDDGWKVEVIECGVE